MYPYVFIFGEMFDPGEFPIVRRPCCDPHKSIKPEKSIVEKCRNSKSRARPSKKDHENARDVRNAFFTSPGSEIIAVQWTLLP